MQQRISANNFFKVDVACPKADIADDGTIKNWGCSVMEHRRLGSKVDHVVAGCRQMEACVSDQDQNYSSDANHGKRN